VKQHHYETRVRWSGNVGQGTSAYTSYRRDHEIQSAGKPVVPGSSDPAFRGDGGRYNPEELLVASLSACHMLWYLHLCSTSQVVVVAYEDNASGVMEEANDGSGTFTRVVLRPVVTVTAESDRAKALALHHEAHRNCFIASSVNFPVEVVPEVVERVSGGAPFGGG
jgi:organic hydroperoxide reductase OsmC/OhrA